MSSRSFRRDEHRKIGFKPCWCARFRPSFWKVHIHPKFFSLNSLLLGFSLRKRHRPQPLAGPLNPAPCLGVVLQLSSGARESCVFLLLSSSCPPAVLWPRCVLPLFLSLVASSGPCPGLVQALSGVFATGALGLSSPPSQVLFSPPCPGLIPCLAAAFICFPFFHRLVRVCFRVAMNATVMRRLMSSLDFLQTELLLSMPHCFCLHEIPNADLTSKIGIQTG